MRVLLKSLPSEIRRRWPGWTVVVVSDATVMRLYGQTLKKNLKKSGLKTVSVTIPPGERSKTHAVKQRVERQMALMGCGRDTVVIALGGGVVGDLAGYVAATYMRGLPYIQAPTTLLAMVDSSVGGKTGIDTEFGKNMIGAFWPPSLVVADTNCLRSLPRAHVINGLVEAIKMALTHDARGFAYILRNIDAAVSGNRRVLGEIIRRAVAIKAGVVARDERESGERMTLNLGHTIGHAVEHLSNYRVMHGVAVALGILVEAQAAVQMGLLKERDFCTIADLFARLKISPRSLKKFDMRIILAATRLDKKSKGGRARYVLLRGIGRVYRVKVQFAHPVPDAVMRRACQSLSF